MFVPAKQIMAGAWTWFNDPRAAIINGEICVGGVTRQGDVIIGTAAKTTPLHEKFEQDDHNNPAILRRESDGRIIVCYSRHASDDNYYQRLSTRPDDVSSWGGETNIGRALGARRYTYANLVEIQDGIFNFVRCASDTDDLSPHVTRSTDGGVSWSAAQKLLSTPGQRPYFKATKSGRNRIDIICTDGHPAERPRDNSVYHLYYLDGDWHASDGTSLGSTPFVPANALTRIYDGVSAPKAWVWDVRPDPTGRPVAVYATFPSPLIDHRYNYAVWDGSRWVSTEICAAGGTLYPPGNDAEPYYSGGMCLDPDAVNTVYVSRETGSGGRDHRNGGTFQLWRGVTNDLGATWTMTQLTFGDSDCFRPTKPRGSNKVLFVNGAYRSFVDFASAISEIAVLPP